MKKVLILLSMFTFLSAQDVGETYIDAADQDYHTDVSPNPPSSRYVDPKVRHLRQLYRQYTRRAFEYRGLSEKFYKDDKGEKKHYSQLADEYEKKAMDIAQQIEDLESGGLNPPSLSERVERRRVEQEDARIKENEKERVGCNLGRRITTSTWQQIPSSTGIGKFVNNPGSDVYPACGEYYED